MRGTNQAIVCLLICFTLIPNIIIAQGEQRCKVKSSKWTHYTIDTCKCLISFEFKFFDSMDQYKGNEACYDVKQVEVGNRYVRYHSIIGEKMDSLGQIHNTHYSWRDKLGVNNNPTWEDVYFNYPKSGELFFTSLLINYEYCYVEPIPKMEWKIIGDKDTIIVKHKCYMATTDFCGRHYTAWFAPDIPIQYGPYKFNGLPGMILKIEDSEKLFSWTATGISVPKNIKPMYFEQGKTVVKTNRKGYLKLLNMRWKDIAMLYKSQGAGVFMAGTGWLKPGQISLPQIPAIEDE